MDDIYSKNGPSGRKNGGIGTDLRIPAEEVCLTDGVLDVLVTEDGALTVLYAVYKYGSLRERAGMERELNGILENWADTGSPAVAVVVDDVDSYHWPVPSAARSVWWMVGDTTRKMQLRLGELLDKGLGHDSTRDSINITSAARSLAERPQEPGAAMGALSHEHFRKLRLISNNPMFGAKYVHSFIGDVIEHMHKHASTEAAKTSVCPRCNH